jgi:hypothetical protein
MITQSMIDEYDERFYKNINKAVDNQITDAEDFDAFCDWYDLLDISTGWHWPTSWNAQAYQRELSEYNAYHYGDE